jgi:hypothetical protein
MIRANSRSPRERSEHSDLGLDVVHPSHVLEAHLLGPLDLGIGQRLGVPIAQELHFEPGHDAAQASVEVVCA